MEVQEKSQVLTYSNRRERKEKESLELMGLRRERRDIPETIKEKTVFS